MSFVSFQKLGGNFLNKEFFLKLLLLKSIIIWHLELHTHESLPCLTTPGFLLGPLPG